MREDMSDEEIERFMREGLSQVVSREGRRLEDLELKVLQALKKRPRRRSWLAWVSAPSLRPAWALAVAAAIFAIGFLVGTWLSNPLQAQGVNFVVFEPAAKEVTLAISYPVKGYREWQDIPMQNRNGLWYITLQLPPGTYEYGFKIDGRWWAYDEAADYYVQSANYTVNAVREVKRPGDRT